MMGMALSSPKIAGGVHQLARSHPWMALTSRSRAQTTYADRKETSIAPAYSSSTTRLSFPWLARTGTETLLLPTGFLKVRSLSARRATADSMPARSAPTEPWSHSRVFRSRRGPLSVTVPARGSADSFFPSRRRVLASKVLAVGLEMSSNSLQFSVIREGSASRKPGLSADLSLDDVRCKGCSVRQAINCAGATVPHVSSTLAPIGGGIRE